MHKIISIQTAQGLLHKQLFHCINLSKNTRKLKSGVDGGRYIEIWHYKYRNLIKVVRNGVPLKHNTLILKIFCTPIHIYYLI